MRLEQLYYLIEISKTHSISVASENLFLAQPSLSNAISSLEKELGIQLLHRSKNGVQLTEVGQEMLLLAQEATGIIEEIYQLAVKKNSEQQIYIHALPAITCSVLPKVLALYQQKQFHMQMNIREEKTHAILKDFTGHGKEKSRHFGIINSNDKINDVLKEHMKTRNIVTTHLCDDEQVCIVNISHPLAQKQTVTKADLLAVPKIRYQFFYEEPPKDDYLSIIKSMNHNASQEIFDDETIMTVNTIEGLKKLVAENLGVAIMPGIVAYGDGYFQSGNLKIVPLADFKIPMCYYLIYNNHQPLLKCEEDFIACVKQVFQQLTKN